MHAKFVAEHLHSAIEQSWEWGVLQTTIPGRMAMFVLGVFDESKEKLIGSMLIIRQEMGMGKSWLWSPRGPLLPEKGTEAAWMLLEDACRDLARQGGDVFMRVEPGILEKEAKIVLGKAAGQSYMPEHTLLINLEANVENILKQMTQKGRYNIKKAHKSGVYVRVGTEEEMDDFYDILKETATRDGFHVHNKGFYSRFLELLGSKGRFYVAHHEQDMIGGLLATHFGDTAIYYFGASSNSYRNKMAPYALQWFAIQEAKKNGMSTYDFLGIAPEGDSKDVLAGVTQFKTRFGGKRVEYQKAQVFVYRPLWRIAYVLAKYVRRFRP